MSESLECRAARLMTVGFSGHTPSGDLCRLVDRGVGGVVYFARNVDSPEQVAALSAAIKQHAGRSLFIAIDQEGGPVARLRQGFTRLPPMRSVGATGDRELARRAGMLLGRELRAVGVDVDFAPVLDVDTNPDNPVIGNRSLSRDPEQVADLGIALVDGIQSAGVAACGKHFPGHGDTSQDSHQELPRLPHSFERLDSVELVPFRAAIGAGVAALMTAHVVFEPLDSAWPATMSVPVLRALLRERLGYTGVIMSDDVEMKAIADHYGYEQAVVQGVLAGIDSFLVCHTAEVAHRMIDAVVQGVEQGSIPEARLDAAAERVRVFTERWARPASGVVEPGVLRCSEHLALAAEIEARAGDSGAAAGKRAEEHGEDPTEIMERLRAERQRRENAS